jgi:pimeloyl-ACP methyl ester carboxylesterase
MTSGGNISHHKATVRWRAASLSLVLPLCLTPGLNSCAISRHILYSPRSEAPAAIVWAGQAPQTLTVTTTDRLALSGYYWPGAASDPDIIVYFHGRNWNAAMGAEMAQYLAGAGNAVLVASYRGFGENPGQPTEKGLLRDAAAFIAKARALAGPEGRIWLVGHSLGSAVALHAAAEDGHVNGVIAMSAFTRIAEGAPHRLRGLIPDRWNNLDPIRSLTIPVLLVQGARDGIIPKDSGDRLLAQATMSTRLVVGAESYHNPDMKRIAPWLNQVIADMAQAPAAPLPSPPEGWTEKARNP